MSRNFRPPQLGTTRSPVIVLSDDEDERPHKALSSRPSLSHAFKPDTKSLKVKSQASNPTFLELSDDESPTQAVKVKSVPRPNEPPAHYHLVAGTSSQLPMREGMLQIGSRGLPPSMEPTTQPLFTRERTSAGRFGRSHFVVPGTQPGLFSTRESLSQQAKIDRLERIYAQSQSDIAASIKQSQSTTQTPCAPKVFSDRNEIRSPPPQVAPPLTKSWTCGNCKEENVGCDGERPCSNCVEPGLACEYPGRPSASLRKVEAPSRATSVPSTKKKTNSLFELLTSATPSSQLAVSSLATGRKTPSGSPDLSSKALMPDTLAHKANENAPQESQNNATQLPGGEPASSPQTGSPGVSMASGCSTVADAHVASTVLVRLEVEDVETLVRKYLGQMRSHREYLMQGAMHQIRVDMKKRGPVLQKQCGDDPFAALGYQSLPASEDSRKSSLPSGRMQIMTKSFVKGLSMGAKWKSTFISPHGFDVDARPMPKYRSIGRLSSSLLARNYHTLKYLPYFAENEYADESQKKRYDELEERYKQDLPQFTLQRTCKELVGFWRPWADAMVEELQLPYSVICRYLLRSEDSQTSTEMELSDSALAAWLSGIHQPCPTCDHHDRVDAETDMAIRTLEQPAPRQQALAGLLCHVFRNVADISLWHIAVDSFEMRNLIHGWRETHAPKASHAAHALCLICYRNHCPVHGSFADGEEDRADSADVYIDDIEIDNNFRQSVTLPLRSSAESERHACGVFCGNPNLPVLSLLGRQADGSISGTVQCQDIVESPSYFKDEVDCSVLCFWNVLKRRPEPRLIKDVQSGDDLALSAQQQRRLTSMVQLLRTNKRGPCMIAKALKGMSCLDIFYHMTFEINSIPHDEAQMAAAQEASVKARTRPVLSNLEFAKTAELDQRPPFVPCTHSGPCQGNPECSCFVDKVVCEWMCGCDGSCKRRYQGCNCASSHVACSDRRCECFSTNRECDPHLCGTCGVAETLDPMHKYDEKARANRCKNSRLQIAVPKRTVKGPSEVQGWGLFAGEDIASGDYIGEYKGELLSNQESDRRGAIYHNLGQEYLFVVNRDQQIDASSTGNKMRFMNNSRKAENINVEARKMLCNGVQRIMLSAKKNIKAGDELLYNYNYPEAVVKNFWERGEGPTSRPEFAPKPNIPSTKQVRNNGRFAKRTSDVREAGQKHASDEAPQLESSQSPIVNRNKKRKRVMSDGIPSRWGTKASKPERGHSPDLGGPACMLDDGQEIQASDESDYTADDASSKDSVPEEHVESEEEESSADTEEKPSPARKAGERERRVFAHDRRLGGQAQRNAWRTRKERMQLQTQKARAIKGTTRK